MPLVEERRTLPAGTLLVRGIPAFLIAFLVSVCLHQGSHVIAARLLDAPTSVTAPISGDDTGTGHVVSGNGLVAVAGPAVSLILAVGSFALFARRPENLFLASMAFVNAAMRLPQTFGLFGHMLLRQSYAPSTDETLALALLPVQDSSGLTAALYFYGLVSLFLTITIVHDIKVIPWKWASAALLLLAMIPLEKALLSLLISLGG